jgi:hypothetical protein
MFFLTNKGFDISAPFPAGGIVSKPFGVVTETGMFHDSGSFVVCRLEEIHHSKLFSSSFYFS